MVNSSTLLGFAMLKANFNDQTHSSFQDNFVSFVVEGVRDRHPRPVTSEEVSSFVNDRFGLEIPSLVAKHILGRAKAKALVIKNPDGTYQCTSAELAGGRSISAEFDGFVRQQNQLSQRLLEFVREHYPERAEQLNREECALLIAHYMDAHALPLLQSGVRGSALDHGNAAEEDFLVSEFVSNAHEADSGIFGLLVEVAKGATLAAILKMDVSSLEASLDKLWIYFDTSIVLNLLGYHGSGEQEASLEILKIGKKLGIRACVFEHTVKEVRGILVAAQHTLRSGGTGTLGFKVAEHFLETDRSAADVEIVIARLEENIKRLGLETKEKPDDYHQFGLDEAELDRLVGEGINYLHDSSRRFDVDSLSAIHRLRQNKSGDSFERARAIFVTRNRQLVLAANKARENSGTFPLALLESSFASLLWVRRPSLAADLPEKRILATAWAGMQPDPGRWIQYLAEADKMVQRGELAHEDALLLRLSTSSRHELMRRTTGDPEKFLAVPPAELLEKLKTDLSLPLVSKIEELQAQQRTQQDTADVEIMALRKELKKAGEYLERSHERERSYESNITKQRERLYQRANKRGVKWANLTFGIALLIPFGIVLLSQIVSYNKSNTLAVENLVLLGAAGIMFLTSLLSICGVNIAKVIPPLTRRISKMLFERSLLNAGLEPVTQEELQSYQASVR